MVVDPERFFDDSDSLVQRFEYADGRTPVAMTMEDVRYYLAYDQVGFLRIVTDGSGNIVKRIDYDSYGNILDDSNASFAVTIGFAGGLHDRYTGLVRFGYRDFETDTGRWTAKDPIGFEGGDSDLYGYVFNNPVNIVDPDGQIPVPLIGAGIGAAVNAYNSRDLWAKGEYKKF